MRILNVDGRSTVLNHTRLKTTSKLITGVGNKMNHRLSGQKWSRLCNRCEIGSHLEQMAFKRNSGKHQEKMMPSYFDNSTKTYGGKIGGQKTGAELHLSRFPRK